MDKLDLQTGRAFRLPDERAALVAAVAQAKPDFKNETNWIEWKSTFALDEAVGGFLIAKAVMGFANREPSRAAVVCEGTAYMIVGVEPRKVSGVERVDFAVLHDNVGKYTNSVRWEPHYVEYGGKDVLVVVVEAPRDGDRMHTLQRDYEKYRAGTAFHRGPGKTEPANAREIVMLENRLLAGTVEPELDVKLTVRATPIVRLVGGASEWFTQREAMIRSSVERPPDPPPPPPARSPSWRSGGPVIPNIPTVDPVTLGKMMGRQYATADDAAEFERRIQQHIAACRSRLFANVLQRIVASPKNGVVFDVANPTDDPIERAELVVRIPRSGIRVYTTTPSAEKMPDLPRWPGQYDQLAKMASMSAASLNPYNLAQPGRPEVEQRGEFYEIAFTIGDLPPRKRRSTDAITIVAGPEAPEAVPVLITATAMNRRSYVELEKAVPVVSAEEQSWRLSDWINP